MQEQFYLEGKKKPRRKKRGTFLRIASEIRISYNYCLNYLKERKVMELTLGE